MSDPPSHFSFKFHDASADLLYLKNFEILDVLKGDLDPILEFANRTCFDSVQQNFPYQEEDTMKAFRLLQMGAQYLVSNDLLYTQQVAKKKAEMATAYTEYEKENYDKLKEFSEK